MKRMMISFLVVMIGLAPVADAQKSKHVRKPPTNQKATKAKQEKTAAGESISLLSIGMNEAYDTAQRERLYISDPTINALKKQAAGITPLVSPSGVVGMPNWAYGFSNGKVLLRSTTAPSSGTMYGSGAVGTGTSLMGLSTGERAIGVNGKNPNLGTWFWGSKSPIRNLPFQDSTRRWR